LDGLDEVETNSQPDCVAAINAFIEESNPSGLLVCCRLNEYRWLPERLKLNGAICLEPLSSEEVSKFLANGGSDLVALRDAVSTDPGLHELAQTPLMLSIMTLAFQGAGGNELASQKGASAEERRKQIFRIYVERMFQRKKTASDAFPKQKTIGWLSWFAREMKEHSQSVFLVEELQPSWLGTKRVAYGTAVALSLGLIFGPIFGLSERLIFSVVDPRIFGLAELRQQTQVPLFPEDLLLKETPKIFPPGSPLIFDLNGGLMEGLTFGLIVGLAVLVGVGFGCWSESPLRNGVISGSISGLIVGLIIGIWNGLSLAGLLQLAASSFRTIKYWSGFAEDF
jgi:hypothetical protein